MCLRRVVGRYSKPGEGELTVTFEGEVTGGAWHEGTDEIAECKYFPMRRLPKRIRTHLPERIDDFLSDASSVFARNT